MIKTEAFLAKSNSMQLQYKFNSGPVKVKFQRNAKTLAEFLEKKLKPIVHLTSDPFINFTHITAELEWDFEVVVEKSSFSFLVKPIQIALELNYESGDKKDSLTVNQDLIGLSPEHLKIDLLGLADAHVSKPSLSLKDVVLDIKGDDFAFILYF